MSKVKFNLPDFIIIGANKAGTTSIANYLNMHPHIKMSRVKEPMFFSSESTMESANIDSASLSRPYFALTLNEYSKMFSGGWLHLNLRFGEASTSYLANPFRSAGLMRKIVPDAKLIAILRDPVDRAVSAYKMCVGNGIESRSFSEVVDTAADEMKILNNHGVKEYIRNGLYHQLLAPYFDLFRREQVLILSFDELKENPQSVLSKIFGFVGVRDFGVSTQRKFNTASDNLKQEVEIKQVDIDRLRALYRQELEGLQKELEFDISHWIAG